VCGSIAKGWRAVALTLALAGASLEAKAQQVPAAEGPTVVAPRLKVDAGVTYPRQALVEHFTDSVTVSLVLEVDASGAVRKATVTEPRGHGFDEVALQAAQRLLFEPATRNGSPVAARIRFRYDFKAPAPRLAGRVATQATDRPIAGALVTVRDASGAEHRTATAADGTWTLLDLPQGHVHIVVTSEGREAQETEENVAAGEETTVVLRLAPPREAPAPATEDAGTDAGEAVEEVNVRGARPPREVTKRTLGKEEIAHIPGTNGDALRSLQNLPGIARPPPFNGALIVRGSAPIDTNVFIDGTNIPLVYHFGGLSSVVPTELLDRIDFYPGNYSAMYGRGMGGVVDVGLRDPKKEGHHGVAQVDLIDTRLLVEGPIAGGWSFLAAGRRSWFDVYLGPVLLKATGAGVTTAPRYYDGQLMIEKDFDRHSSFRVLLFGSDDALELINQTPNSSNPTVGGDLGFHTSFWRVQARYENKLTDRTGLRLTAAYGRDSVDFGFGVNGFNVNLHPLSGRAELTEKIAHGITANAGVDMLYEPYDFTSRLPPRVAPGIPSGGPGQIPVQSRESSTLFLPGAYLELELDPWSGTRVVPGVRADYDSATSGWDVSPRLTVRQDLTKTFPRTTLKGAVGLFYQPPSVLEIAPNNVTPNYEQSGLSSNRAVHYDVGFEQEFTREIDLSTDIFYKSMDRLAVPGLGNSGEGFVYGAEWLVRYKPDERLFGWLSYTLLRSERRNLPGQPYALFQYDQTHVLTVLGSYQLGRGWQVGARFRLTSGDLYTPSEYGAYNATVGSQLGVAAFPPYGARLPLFQQFDVRVDKVWTFSHWKLTAYVDVQNVFNATNSVGVSYNYNFTQSTNINGLPILPSIGLRGEL
jgi:TonB family protein